MNMNRKFAWIALFVAVAIGGSAAYWLRSTNPRPGLDKSQSLDSGVATKGVNEKRNAKAGPLADLITIPRNYRFGDVDSVASEHDYQDLLSRYGKIDHDRISAFYKAYGAIANGSDDENVFTFHSEKELAWLVSNGYPTPDDILASDRMTESELQKLAQSGNFKGKVFLLDRLDSKRQLPVGELGAFRADLASSRLAREVLVDGSPFGALAFARHSNELGDPPLAAAGLSFANTLGDDRSGFLRAYLEEHDVLPADILLANKVVQLTASRNPRMGSIRDLARRPRFSESASAGHE